MSKLSPNNESRSERHRRMVSEMSNLRTIKWVAVAFAIHIVVIGATSYRSFQHLARTGHLFETDEEVKAAQAAKLAEAEAVPAAPATAAPAPATATEKPADAKTKEMSDDEKRLAELSKSNNPEAKKLTELPKPGETPKGPSLKLNEDP